MPTRPEHHIRDKQDQYERHPIAIQLQPPQPTRNCLGLKQEATSFQNNSGNIPSSR